MEDKRPEDMTIKELKTRLETITTERQEIVALVQEVAESIRVEAGKPTPAATPRTPRIAKAITVPRTGTTEDRVKAVLGGGKVMASGDLVAALVKDGAKKGTAMQFLYGKLGKKILKKTDEGWKLK